MLKKFIIFITLLALVLPFTAPVQVHAQFGLGAAAAGLIAAAATQTNTPTGCGISISCAFKWVINNFVQSLFAIVLQFFALLLYIAGRMFDFVISETIVNMGVRVRDLAAINTIWKLFRDLTNMTFIFVLTYAGVATILNLKSVQWREQLRNIIIAALLINFSLFITKIPIDISNILSIQFYKAIVSQGEKEAEIITSTNSQGVNVVNTLAAQSISGVFMNNLRIQSFYAPDKVTTGGEATASNFLDLTKILITTVFGASIMLVVACIFMAGSIMLIMRFGLLIYTLVISPLFFLGMVLPKAGNLFSSHWKKNLISQCLFAPVLFLLLFVSAQFMRGLTIPTGQFTQLIAGNEQVGNMFSQIGNLLLNYIFIIFMLLGSLAAAREAGGIGGAFFDKQAKRFAGAPARFFARPVAAAGGSLYRNTAGRAADKLSNSTAMRWAAQQTGLRTITRGTQANLNNAAKASGDFRNVSGGLLGEGRKGGYKEVEKENKDAKTAYQQKQRENEFTAAKDAFIKNQNDATQDRLQKALNTLGDSALDKVKASEINKMAGFLTPAQFARLATGDKSPFSDREKAELIEAKLGQKAPGKKSIADLTIEIGGLYKAIEAEDDPTKKAALEASLPKDIEALNKELGGNIRGLTDKEREVITPYIFNNKDKHAIQAFVENLNQGQVDKLKNLDALSGSQRKVLKDIRTNLVKNIANDIRKQNAIIESAAEDSAEYIQATSALLKAQNALKQKGIAEIVGMGADFLARPEIIPLLGPEYLKKMIKDENFTSATYETGEKNPDGTAKTVTVDDFYKHLKEQAKEYVGPNNERHPSWKFMLKDDNAGLFGITQVERNYDPRTAVHEEPEMENENEDDEESI